MLPQPAWRPRTFALVLCAPAVFVLCFFLRYNDPEGSFGGLTDDHSYYVVHGWQMLFGQLPDRDYFEFGAPLQFATSAVLQILLGRSIWSEFIFDATVISVGAAMTYSLATRATGSIVLGVTAALLEIALIPRMYNYPKIVVYAVAISLLWAWASNPRTRLTWLMALLTAIAFLMRHDHGVYVGAAFAVLLLAMRELPWRVRVRQGVIFGLATLLFLAPYLGYLQVNGGIARHFLTTYRWQSKDYRKDPLRLPTLTWHPLFEESPSDDAPVEEWWNHAPFLAMSTYYTWWLFWLITLLPALALLLLVVCPATGPPERPRTRVKIFVVAVLAIILNNRFLRGSLAGRFADVSVPLAILVAWSLAAIVAILRSRRIVVHRRTIALGLPSRAAIVAATVAVVLVTAAILVRPARELLNSASFDGGPATVLSDAAQVTQELRHTWPLDGWVGNRGGPVALARYVEACTAPTDSILVTPLLPAIAMLAQRPFAGGHLDLRAGYFDTVEEQTLTIERLQRQSVPIVIGPPARELSAYAASLPLIAEYLNRDYVNLGDKDVGNQLVVSLFVHRAASSVRTYEPLSFPCFR